MIFFPLAVLNRQWDQQCYDLRKTMDTTDRGMAALSAEQLFQWRESIQIFFCWRGQFVVVAVYFNLIPSGGQKPALLKIPHSQRC